MALCAAATGAVWLSAQGAAPASRIRGFSAASSAAQAAREREMKAAPSAKLAEADFDVMTAEPHHTGSPYEIKLADYVSDEFKKFGIEATKYEYGVLLPWPGRRRIDIVAPDTLKLEVEEEKIRGDQWADKPGILPAYNAYSPSGDVTGEIVYVNYGIPADYETLREARHRREGQDRAGALRRQLARHQAEGRGRARRHRLHHLLGSARGRLLPGRGLSRRPVSRLGDDSARQRDGHAALSRRSVDARPPVEARRRAAGDGQDRDLRADSGAADVLSRRHRAAQAAEGAGRARSVARRAAADLPHRPRSGEGAHEPADGLRAAPPDQRRRPDHRRGRAGRMDHRRIASRRVDLRRVRLGQRPRVDDERRPRDGRDDEEGVEAAAQRALRQLGRRRTGAARIDRVGRRSRRPS